MNPGEKNSGLDWYSPYCKWEYNDPDELNPKHVEESFSITSKTYELKFALNNAQKIEVETKIEGHFLILKLYRKKEFLHQVSKSKENVYQLFFCKKVLIQPDMIPEEIDTILKENEVTIEIPRKSANNTNETNSYPETSFKEPYFG